MLRLDLNCSDPGRMALHEKGLADIYKNGVEILDASLGVKSPNTVMKRLYAIKTYNNWVIRNTGGHWLPVLERNVWLYFKSLREEKAPATRATSLLEALRFCHFIFRIDGCETTLSSLRIKGLAQQLYTSKRPWRPADPFRVSDIVFLHRSMLDCERSVVDRVFIGHLLHMVYSRSRFSDMLAATGCMLDAEKMFLEFHASVHKGARLARGSSCAVRLDPPDPEVCPVGSMVGDEPAAYMGPLQLPEGAGYLTPQQRQDILAEYGVVAVVRIRSQWRGRRALSLSGPVDQLLPARRRCMELLDIDNLETVNRSKASGTPPEQLPQRTATWDEQNDRRRAPRQRGGAKAPGPKSASSAAAGNSASGSAPSAWGDAAMTGWAWAWGPQAQWWSYPQQPVPYGYGYWQQLPTPGSRPADDEGSSSTGYPRRRRRGTPTEPKRPPRQPPGVTAGASAKPAAPPPVPPKPAGAPPTEPEARATTSKSKPSAPGKPQAKIKPKVEEHSSDMEEIEIEESEVEESESSSSMTSSAKAPSLPVEACPAAALDARLAHKAPVDPHTPPGYVRVRDSQKCAARLINVKEEALPASTEPENHAPEEGPGEERAEKPKDPSAFATPPRGSSDAAPSTSNMDTIQAKQEMIPETKEEVHEETVASSSAAGVSLATAVRPVVDLSPEELADMEVIPGPWSLESTSKEDPPSPTSPVEPPVPEASPEPMDTAVDRSADPDGLPPKGSN
eukprot:s2955_g9.t1